MKKYLDYLKGCIHRTLFLEPESDSPSYERELNEWADALAWNPGWSKGADSGLNCPPRARQRIRDDEDGNENVRVSELTAEPAGAAKTWYNYLTRWKTKFFT